MSENEPKIVGRTWPDVAAEAIITLRNPYVFGVLVFVLLVGGGLFAGDEVLGWFRTVMEIIRGTG